MCKYVFTLLFILCMHFYSKSIQFYLHPFSEIRHLFLFDNRTILKYVFPVHCLFCQAPSITRLLHPVWSTPSLKSHLLRGAPFPSMADPNRSGWCKLRSGWKLVSERDVIYMYVCLEGSVLLDGNQVSVFKWSWCKSVRNCQHLTNWGQFHRAAKQRILLSKYFR